jgi:hypothetical protein
LDSEDAGLGLHDFVFAELHQGGKHFGEIPLEARDVAAEGVEFGGG